MSDPYKYYYSEEKGKVICVSHYAGKPVRGVAVCSPSDTFDLETGKKLAKLRCDVKVAALRAKRAHALWLEANENFLKAEEVLTMREGYLWDSDDRLSDALSELSEFTSKI